MDKTQIVMIVLTLAAFVLLGLGMSWSIKRHEARPKGKTKKGKTRYMPQVKNPGR